MRNYDSALIYHSMAIRAAPDWSSGYKNKMETMFRKTGKTKEMKPIMQKGIHKTGDKFLYEKVMLDIYDGKFSDAEKKIKESDSTEFGGKGSMYILLGKIHSYSLEFDVAKSYFTKASDYFKNKLKNEPEDLSLNSSLGIAYAGIKKVTEAKEEGEKAADPARTDALHYPEYVENLALIYTMVGEYDNAFDKINYLLSNNTCFTVNHLQLDQEWKPLRDKTKYQDLIMKYSKK
jgi:tetratricopeptide (TPR) repeat protein